LGGYTWVFPEFVHGERFYPGETSRQEAAAAMRHSSGTSQTLAKVQL